MREFRIIMRFFNLLDRSNNLSITNIAVIICLVKMCLAPSVSFLDASALLISLANYVHKRKENTKVECEVNEQVKQLKVEFSSVSNQVEEIKSLHSTLEKQAEEIKQNLNAIRLAKR